MKSFPTCFHLCQSKCIGMLTDDNIKTFVTWAYALDVDNLLNACYDYIKVNRTNIFLDEDFLALCLEERALWKLIVAKSL